MGFLIKNTYDFVRNKENIVKCTTCTNLFSYSSLLRLKYEKLYNDFALGGSIKNAISLFNSPYLH